MEAKIMDFKQFLKSNSNVNNKQDSLTKKDFNSTLESVNNKDNSYKENSQNHKKVNSEESSNINGNCNSVNDIDKIDLDNEEKIINKKDYQTGYEGIMFLFTNTVEIKSNDVINEDNLLNVVIDTEGIDLKNNEKNDLETAEELIVENEVISSEFLKTNESQEFDTKESKENKEPNIVINNYKDSEIKMDSKESIKILENKVDNEIEKELSINIIKDSININQTIKNDNLDNLDSKHDSKESTSNQEELIVKTINYKDELDVKNKPFSFFEKNEIITDNVIEIEKTDIIDRKDLIQQIVDKMKVNLSESKSEIKINLKPEVLGEMTINIEVVKGEIIAKIMVDNLRTKEIIETNLIQLKEGIKDTALEIKTFEVFVGSGSDFDRHNSNQFNLKQNNKKIKIKTENSKTVKSYEEKILENQMNATGIYSENGLNLFA